MQTKRPARISSDRAKSIRPNAPSIVLWRPDIVLAPGTVLTSLAASRDGATARTPENGARDSRVGRERGSAPARVTATLGDLLTRPAIHVATSTDQQGWR